METLLNSHFSRVDVCNQYFKTWSFYDINLWKPSITIRRLGVITSTYMMLGFILLCGFLHPSTIYSEEIKSDINSFISIDDEKTTAPIFDSTLDKLTNSIEER